MRQTPRTNCRNKHFTLLLAEYDEEQAAFEASMTKWQEQIDNWNADKLKMEKLIELVKHCTDFSEITMSMLNEFIEKVVVHEAAGGRGNSCRQRLDIYLNFIGVFEVPAHIVTPMEAEANAAGRKNRRQRKHKAGSLKRHIMRNASRKSGTSSHGGGSTAPCGISPEEKRADKAKPAAQTSREPAEEAEKGKKIA